MRFVLCQILPLDLGLSIELAYPSPALCAQLYLSRTHDLNTFVDCVLSTVYNSLAGPTNSGPEERRHTGNEPQRRKLVFSSFAPDVCAALNWKQPNCKCVFGLMAWFLKNMYRCRVLRVRLWCLEVAFRDGCCVFVTSGQVGQTMRERGCCG